LKQAKIRLWLRYGLRTSAAVFYKFPVKAEENLATNATIVTTQSFLET
jgi:hypothetical protein